MARELMQSGLPSPRMDDLPDPRTWNWHYDKEDDVLHLAVTEPRPAISIDVDGQFWIRIDPETGEVFGFEFEDFESVFLQLHPNVAAAWRELNRPKKVVQLARASWLTILQDLIARTFNSSGGNTPRIAPV